MCNAVATAMCTPEFWLTVDILCNSLGPEILIENATAVVSKWLIENATAGVSNWLIENATAGD